MIITNQEVVAGNNLKISLSSNEIVAEKLPDIAIHQSIFNAKALVKELGYLKGAIICSEQKHFKLSQLNRLPSLLDVDQLKFTTKSLKISATVANYARSKITNIVFNKVEGIWKVTYVVTNPFLSAEHIAEICSTLMVFNTILLKWYLPDAFFTTGIDIEFVNQLTNVVTDVNDYEFPELELEFTPVFNRDHRIVGTSTPRFLNREFNIV